MERQNKIVIWPIYFDSAKSRKQGRKVPKKLSIPNPKAEEVVEAVKRLGLKPEVTQDAAYPKIHWSKSGVIYVYKEKRKLRVLKEVGRELVELRSRVDK